MTSDVHYSQGYSWVTVQSNIVLYDQYSWVAEVMSFTASTVGWLSCTGRAAAVSVTFRLLGVVLDKFSQNGGDTARLPRIFLMKRASKQPSPLHPPPPHPNTRMWAFSQIGTI